ncbi:hypothetical protein BDN70DRAFT_690771 [Pholiota conissans]|uniref:Uncharacterized protein n=1 Tax=Pholiota conissans TaxID=109636 RepID=A0A9P5Z403_9AGAR|nr:hypothetical protein BDN70DRAFT_690771 [Pholiota conissans]
MSFELPAEIWTQIFDLAADEDILFQPGIPTVMAESAWYKDRILDQWRLRSPGEALNLLQRRSYATKKAIMATCRQWRALGAEFLFRFLHFSDPMKLISLASIMDSSSTTASTSTASLGWWTRRIHIARYHPSPIHNMTIQDLENALVSVIKHCPNLEIFVIERPMGSAFGPVADALANHAYRKLHTVQWNVPGGDLGKVIWSLNTLPCLIAVHIDIETAVESSQEVAHLGSAGNLRLMLPALQQLSVRGYVEELVDQAAGWDLPSLLSFSVSSGTSINDVPDVVEFLRNHGAELVLLDLDLAPIVDVAAVLDLCPNLCTFTFNGDWRISPHDDVASELTRLPHNNITTVGVHGLSYAFGVGYAAIRMQADPFRTGITARSNDLNVAALNRRNFPKLRRVRALNRNLLDDLNQANGPSMENGGYDRWNRWWNACANQGVRLEDCTGQVLGTLPEDEDDESSSEEEEDEEDEDGEEEYEDGEDGEKEEEGSEEEYDREEYDSDEYEEEVEFPVPPLPEGNGRTMELTRLLQEVRIMNAGRDEAMIARIRPPLPDSP